MTSASGVENGGRPGPARPGAQRGLAEALIPPVSPGDAARTQPAASQPHVWITAACGQRILARQIGSLFGRE